MQVRSSTRRSHVKFLSGCCTSSVVPCASIFGLSIFQRHICHRMPSLRQTLWVDCIVSSLHYVLRICHPSVVTSIITSSSRETITFHLCVSHWGYTCHQAPDTRPDRNASWPARKGPKSSNSAPAPLPPVAFHGSLLRRAC